MTDPLREEVEREMRAFIVPISRSLIPFQDCEWIIDHAVEVAVRIARNLAHAAEGAHRLAEEALVKAEVRAQAAEMVRRGMEKLLADEWERRGHAKNCACRLKLDSRYQPTSEEIRDPRCVPPPAIRSDAEPPRCETCGSDDPNVVYSIPYSADERMPLGLPCDSAFHSPRKGETS